MAKNILVVDDSEIIRQLVSVMLTDDGYTPIEAVNGEDALNKLDGADDIEMVITDLHMPRMNGLELIRRLRQDPEHKFLPIVMITSASHENAKKLGEMVGADAWITKPFMSEDLMHSVKRFTGQYTSF